MDGGNLGDYKFPYLYVANEFSHATPCQDGGQIGKIMATDEPLLFRTRMGQVVRVVVRKLAAYGSGTEDHQTTTRRKRGSSCVACLRLWAAMRRPMFRFVILGPAISIAF